MCQWHQLIRLYVCRKFCQSISKGFRVTDPNSRDDARVVANVDACMKLELTNGWKTVLCSDRPAKIAATQIFFSLFPIFYFFFGVSAHSDRMPKTDIKGVVGLSK